MRVAYAMENGNAAAKIEGEANRTAVGSMTLLDAEPGQTYIIKEINTDDDEMNSFLFRLGCYPGEPITLISKKKKSCIVVIKDGRYNLDKLLSEAIII
jgi:ferrous iron transport protein A